MAELPRAARTRRSKRAVGKSRKLAARRAAPHPGSAPRRLDRDSRPARPPPRRPGREFLAIPPLPSGEPAQNVDWRRSARDDHLYVREREWEASHTIWLWADRSPSMDFTSPLTEWSKLDRALVVSFALAEVLVQGGERIGIPELLRPTANRNVIEKMAQAIVHDSGERPSLPPNFSPAAFSEVLLLSDFWSPIAEFRRILGQLAAAGARGHVVQVVDPAEESFPYSGRVEFIESEGLGSVTAGRAETWRNDYQKLVADHRAALRAECEQFGWSFTVHRTDRGPTELLFAIHARMGASAQAPTIGARHVPMLSGGAA